MKRNLLLVFFFLLVVSNLFAKGDDTLLVRHTSIFQINNPPIAYESLKSNGGGEKHIGMFLNILGEMQSLQGRDAYCYGGQTGFAFGGNMVVFGLSLNGFQNSYDYDKLLSGRPKAQMRGMYGGIYIAPIVPGANISPVNLSLPIMVGIGRSDYYSSEGESLAGHDFKIIKVGAELEFTFLRGYRIAVGAYYHRILADPMYYKVNSSLEVPDAQLNQFSIGVVMKLGKFGAGDPRTIFGD